MSPEGAPTGCRCARFFKLRQRDRCCTLAADQREDIHLEALHAREQRLEQLCRDVARLFGVKRKMVVVSSSNGFT